MGKCAYRVGAGMRRRRAVEGEEEALGGVGDAGGPVHRARPRRFHPLASMTTGFLACLLRSSSSSKGGEEIEGEGWILPRMFFLLAFSFAKAREGGDFPILFRGHWI